MFKECTNSIVNTLNNLPNPDPNVLELSKAITVGRKMIIAIDKLQIGGGNVSTLNSLSKLGGEIDKLNIGELRVVSDKVDQLIVFINLYLDKVTRGKARLGKLKAQLEGIKIGLEKRSAKL